MGSCRCGMPIRFLHEENEPSVAVSENDYQRFIRIDIERNGLTSNIYDFSGVYEHLFDRNKNKCYQRIGKPKKFLQWIRVEAWFLIRKNCFLNLIFLLNIFKK